MDRSTLIQIILLIIPLALSFAYSGENINKNSESETNREGRQNAGSNIQKHISTFLSALTGPIDVKRLYKYATPFMTDDNVERWWNGTMPGQLPGSEIDRFLNGDGKINYSRRAPGGLFGNTNGAPQEGSPTLLRIAAALMPTTEPTTTANPDDDDDSEDDDY